MRKLGIHVTRGGGKPMVNTTSKGKNEDRSFYRVRVILVWRVCLVLFANE